jgi:hypothetical protein
MSEEPRDIVLEYQRRIDERTRTTQLDIEELKSLANILRNDVGNLKRENDQSISCFRG